jgi:hypothetical protein
VDDGSAAVAFDPGELGVKAGAEDAECLGSLTDAGVLGDDQQAVQALAAWEPWRSGSGISLGWCPAVVSGLAYSCWAPSPSSAPSRGTPAAGHRLPAGGQEQPGFGHPTAHLGHAHTGWFSTTRRTPLSLAAPLTQGRLRRWWNRPADARRRRERGYKEQVPELTRVAGDSVLILTRPFRRGAGCS